MFHQLRISITNLQNNALRLRCHILMFCKHTYLILDPPGRSILENVSIIAPTDCMPMHEEITSKCVFQRNKYKVCFSYGSMAFIKPWIIQRNVITINALLNPGNRYHKWESFLWSFLHASNFYKAINLWLKIAYKLFQLHSIFPFLYKY